MRRPLAPAGINIAPLLASVGGLGLAVGLATQSVAQNVVAAVSLYSGGPFSIGDKVELHSAGVLIAAGTVTAVEPLATTLRNADGNPSERLLGWAAAVQGAGWMGPGVPCLAGAGLALLGGWPRDSRAH